MWGFNSPVLLHSIALMQLPPLVGIDEETRRSSWLIQSNWCCMVSESVWGELEGGDSLSHRTLLCFIQDRVFNQLGHNQIEGSWNDFPSAWLMHVTVLSNKKLLRFCILLNFVASLAVSRGHAKIRFWDSFINNRDFKDPSKNLSQLLKTTAAC